MGGVEMDSRQLNERLSLLANLGVVVGLAILILEINSANKLAETQAVALRLEQMQQAQLSFAESDYLPQIRLKAISEGVQSLSKLEQSRLRRWETSVALRMESHYYHYEQGYLDEETGELILSSAARRLKNWKDLDVELLNQRFKRLVEETAANLTDH